MRRCEDGIPSPVMWSVGLYLVIYCDLAGVHLFFEYALLSTRQMRQGAMNWGLGRAEAWRSGGFLFGRYQGS